MQLLSTTPRGRSSVSLKPSCMSPYRSPVAGTSRAHSPLPLTSCGMSPMSTTLCGRSLVSLTPRDVGGADAFARMTSLRKAAFYRYPGMWHRRSSCNNILCNRFYVRGIAAWSLLLFVQGWGPVVTQRRKYLNIFFRLSSVWWGLRYITGNLIWQIPFVSTSRQWC